MSDDKQLREKFKKLLDTAKDLHGKQGELLDELERLLGGQPGIGAQIKAVQAAFDVAWCARYAKGQSGRYLWTHTKDVPQIKRLLKTLGSVQEIERRALTYVKNNDPFFTRARHPFGLFVQSINQHAAESDVDEFDLEPALNGCDHQPPCRTDAEHTRRRREALNA